MLFQKSKPKEPSRADLVDALDGAIEALIRDRLHLTDVANLLEQRAEVVRMRHATTAPII